MASEQDYQSLLKERDRLAEEHSRMAIALCQIRVWCDNAHPTGSCPTHWNETMASIMADLQEVGSFDDSAYYKWLNDN